MSAAIIMICQPAWQLPMTIGLPSASGWSVGDFLDERPPRRAHTSSTVWPGNGVGQEADEVAGMARRQRRADLAVILHAADARAVARARIDDDDRRLSRVDLHALGRNDPDQAVIDRARQLCGRRSSAPTVKVRTWGAFVPHGAT